MTTTPFLIGPAEALLLARPRAAHPFEYFSYALAELIMLGVVKVETRVVQPHPNDPARLSYHFLQKGINFDRYEPLSSHKEFLSYLRKRTEYPLHLLALKIKYDYYDRPRTFMEDYLKPNLVSSGLVSPHMRFLIDLYLPTLRGWKLRRRLWRDMLRLRWQFPDWLTTHPTRAKQCFAAYGPILLMMPGLSFAQLANMPDAWRDVETLKASLADHLSLYDWSAIEHLPKFDQLRTLDTWILAFENAYASKEKKSGTSSGTSSAYVDDDFFDSWDE